MRKWVAASAAFAVAQGNAPRFTARDQFLRKLLSPRFFNRVRAFVGRPGWPVGASLWGPASVDVPYDLG